MNSPTTLRTFDGAEWELRATTQTGTPLYAVKGAPTCCPPSLMATLTELAEHGIQSTELAAAVAESGALPVPVGGQDPQKRARLTLPQRDAELSCLRTFAAATESRHSAILARIADVQLGRDSEELCALALDVLAIVDGPVASTRRQR
ncbi:hypothetical protein [Streptomyces sp. SID12488]|uniref:hypothetical protein n=1 Tax=Streptomyces sp. SID12488 TaxID=2706040 RepID=UPI0013D9FEA4|nr:hypothetical protein [Streptomyces sp. SID12488]NEA61332.1 hypothetical protein [Streptomyces sp. SID12488]